MSIFKVKEWWSTICGSGEEYDVGGMAVGKLDKQDPTSKIITGSFSGMLRVYNPTQKEGRAEDLILEEDLGAPILQVGIGMYLTSSRDLALAVLHPRKLTVYELTANNLENEVEDRNTRVYGLDRYYENSLGVNGEHFSAFCMCSGRFGSSGGQEQEMIMVQSMDGKLQIFEGQNLIFTRQFVDCLYPGPLEYLESIDAFVTVSTACEVQCVRYKNFVSSQKDIRGDSESKTGSFGIAAMKSNVMEWSTVIGEGCLLIFAGLFLGNVDADKNNGYVEEEIMLVGESSLHVLSCGGRLKSQKKLEQTPVCGCSYRRSAGYMDNLAIATQEGSLLIFSELCLIWAARLDSVPVSLKVSTFADHDGMIVAVDGSGRLSINYLGTRPPNSIASSAASRDLDYHRIDEEHRQLLQTIREHQSETKPEPKEKIILRTQLPREIDLGLGGPETDVDMPDYLVTLGEAVEGMQSSQLLKVCVRLFVAYAGSAHASNVNITVSVPGFCHVVPKSCVIKDVKANSTPQLVRLYLYASRKHFVQSLDAEVCVAYQVPSGEHRVSSHPFQIPIFLAFALRAPVKNAAYKYTLDTGDLPAQTATALFEDLVVASHEAGVDIADTLGNTDQAIALQMWCGYPTPEPALVSVLVSKTSGRYRVQSDCLPALAVVIEEIRRRLERIFKDEAEKRESGSAIVSCSDDLPLDAFFDEVDLHLEARKRLQSIYTQVNDQAHLYRVVEKRLLTRFKEKNATPLGGLDDILNDTYSKLTTSSDEASDAQRELSIRHAGIDSISRLIVELAFLRGHVKAVERPILLSYLCPSLLTGKGSCSGDLEGTGWEEMCETALTFLLKTALAGTDKKETNYRASSKPPVMPENSEVLRQRVTLVFSKLEQGRSIMP